MKAEWDELVQDDFDSSAWKHGMILYVDVDDTIIDHHDVPKQHVLKFLEYARSQGCQLYLWSQGGGDYCLEIAEKLGIKDWFLAFLPKPDVCVDDLEINARFIQKHIHPIQLAGVDWVSK